MTTPENALTYFVRAARLFISPEWSSPGANLSDGNVVQYRVCRSDAVV
jgi:hypothetical protein